MADKEGENSTEEGPSLEMPSFGFGRKKKGKRAQAAEEPPREETAVPEAAAVPPEPEPASEPEPAAPEPEPAPAPVEETRQLDPVEQAPEPEGRPLFADETEAATAEATPTGTATQTEVQPGPEPVPEPEPKRRARRVPAVTGMPAAVLIGAFVGLLLVGLTWGSLHLCELVRGTSACGKPGFLVLLAIMVILIVVGASLLRAVGIQDPGSTSFLGVGLIAVLLLLFLVELLFNWWMVIVVPVLGVISFALAHWVSTAFVEPD